MQRFDYHESILNICYCGYLTWWAVYKGPLSILLTVRICGISTSPIYSVPSEILRLTSPIHNTYPLLQTEYAAV